MSMGIVKTTNAPPMNPLCKRFGHEMTEDRRDDCRVFRCARCGYQYEIRWFFDRRA